MRHSEIWTNRKIVIPLPQYVNMYVPNGLRFVLRGCELHSGSVRRAPPNLDRWFDQMFSRFYPSPSSPVEGIASLMGLFRGVIHLQINQRTDIYLVAPSESVSQRIAINSVTIAISQSYVAAVMDLTVSSLLIGG